MFLIVTLFMIVVSPAVKVLEKDALVPFNAPVNVPPVKARYVLDAALVVK